MGRGEAPDLKGLELFLDELALYRRPLRLGLERLVGREKAAEALAYLGQMERQGAYISDPDVGRRLGAFFVGNEEDLGFYVILSHSRQFALDVGKSGKATPAGLTLQSRPLFLYWPSAIANLAQQMTKFPLPCYFAPWVHEFGHFLCYWLQPWPVMAATGILLGALSKRGIALSHVRDLEGVTPHEMPEDARQIVRMLIEWSSLNEAMAIWWEEQLLTAMEFQAERLLEAKKRYNPFIRQLEGKPCEEVLAYIAHWTRPGYHADRFSKNFVTSLNNLNLDKWSFLNTA